MAHRHGERDAADIRSAAAGDKNVSCPKCSACGCAGMTASDSLDSAVLLPDGTPRDVSSQAIVPWWSFTKTLIAAAALILVRRKRLSLEAPLPGLPYSLRQLLQHTAGVGNYGGLPEYHAAVARGDAPWSRDELYVRIPPTRLLFAPGAGWEYSN